MRTARFLIYIFIWLLCAAYAAFIDAGFGLPFAAALTVAPLGSLLCLKLAAGRVSAEMTLSRATVYKGETVDLTLTLRNGSVMPIPFLEIRICMGENLTPGTGGGPRSHTVTVPAKGSGTLTIPYTAVTWGPAEASAEDPVITDFTGFFTLRPRFAARRERAAVCPDLREPGRNELAAILQSEAARGDGGREETPPRGAAFEEPGYEHREYGPGDTPRMVNWKLSAKRGEWLVRGMESPEFSPPSVVLDPCRAPGKERDALSEERLVEGFLSMLLALRRLGTDCEAYLFTDGWEAFPIGNMEDIEALQRALAPYAFREGAPSRVPAPPPGRSPLAVFSCFPDGALFSAAGHAHIVCAAPPGPARDGSVWAVGENGDFYRCGEREGRD
ncbi:MAG: DUF58 domain-containing protein [Oscillospiraceae bacterium]|jgi:uncharacterized protein (DUF58 family)|nr:DUF58 domain-containing protein [Oscillospiraceae bacterium]